MTSCSSGHEIQVINGEGAGVQTRSHKPARSPIEETIARAAEKVPYFSASFGEPAEGMVCACDLVNDPVKVATYLDYVESVYQMDKGNRQIAASFLVLGYFWPPMLGAAACMLLERRVPDLSAQNVWVNLNGYGVRFSSPRFYALPDDPDAMHPNATILPDVEALRHYIAHAFTNEHAEPLFASLRSVAPYGVNGMRANYVDRMVSALIWVGDVIGDPAIAATEVPAFVTCMTDKRRAGVVQIEHSGKPRMLQLRSGCCLNYRLPGREKCETCCLLSMDERIVRFRASIDQEASAAD